MKFVNGKKIILLLAILLAVSIVGNITIYMKYRHAKDHYIEERSKPKFELLSPRIAWMNTEEFLNVRQNKLSISKHAKVFLSQKGNERGCGQMFHTFANIRESGVKLTAKNQKRNID